MIKHRMGNILKIILSLTTRTTCKVLPNKKHFLIKQKTKHIPCMEGGISN